MRGEETIAELCRREGIAQSLYYKWSKAFLERGQARLNGNTKRQAGSHEVDDLRRENGQFKQLGAELALKNRVLKESYWLGRRGGQLMRYSQSERMEVIRLVEGSDLRAKRTLAELTIPPSTFYRWYKRHQEAGYAGLADRKPQARQLWNRIPDEVRDHIGGGGIRSHAAIAT